MNFEPDYARYSLRDLIDISENIDRERYPQRAKRVDAEIAARQRQDVYVLPSDAEPPTEPKFSLGRSESESGRPFAVGASGPKELVLEFRGSAKEYFRIWIVNLCLTLLTFGIFSPWAKVRKKRFSYSHTLLDGTPFQYLANPIPILKGRIIAGVGFLAYYITSHFITSLVPWVLGCGAILAPWVITRSAAFNTRYSAYRNMTFRFRAGYLEAFKTLYVWGLVPALMLLGFVEWPGQGIYMGVVSAVFGLFFPWWLSRLKKLLIENTSFGGQNASFWATGGQFFGIYFISGLIVLAFTFPMGVLIGFLAAGTTSITGFVYIQLIAVYAGYVFAYAFVKARSGNLVYNNIRLGPIHFESTLRAMDLVKLYVTNAIGIVASLGMLIPWAVVRTWKYRADHTRVWLAGDLTGFRGSERDRVGATGAEALDYFDVDIAI